MCHPMFLVHEPLLGLRRGEVYNRIGDEGGRRFSRGDECCTMTWHLSWCRLVRDMAATRDLFVLAVVSDVAGHSGVVGSRVVC